MNHGWLFTMMTDFNIMNWVLIGISCFTSIACVMYYSLITQFKDNANLDHHVMEYNITCPWHIVL